MESVTGLKAVFLDATPSVKDFHSNFYYEEELKVEEETETHEGNVAENIPDFD